jgi:hypothetical protein
MTPWKSWTAETSNPRVTVCSESATSLRLYRGDVYCQNIRDFPAASPAMARNLIFIELPKTTLHALEILVVQRAELRRQAAKVYGARLVQAGHHRLIILADRDEPTSLALVRGGGDNEIKSVSKLLIDHHRPREEAAFAVDFRSDILADARPPNITFRDQRRSVRGFMPKAARWASIPIFVARLAPNSQMIRK